jgi:hypothetical protein
VSLYALTPESVDAFPQLFYLKMCFFLTDLRFVPVYVIVLLHENVYQTYPVGLRHLVAGCLSALLSLGIGVFSPGVAGVWGDPPP